MLIEIEYYLQGSCFAAEKIKSDPLNLSVSTVVGSKFISLLYAHSDGVCIFVYTRFGYLDYAAMLLCKL